MKLLLERIEGFGDVLASTATFQGLHERYPNLELYYRSGFPGCQVLLNDPRLRGVTMAADQAYDQVIYLDHGPVWLGGHLSIGHVLCQQLDVAWHPPAYYPTDAEKRWALATFGPDVVLVANKPLGGQRSYNQLREVVMALNQEYTCLQLDLDGQELGCHRPRLTLREVGGLCYSARCYVGVDTGFMHLAAAAGLPMVLVMGLTGWQNQYVPHARICRPAPWRGTGDARYGSGIDLDPQVVLDAFQGLTRPEVEVTGADGRPR